MKRNTLRKLLFSGLGVVAILVLLVAVNFLAGLVKQRVDLTQEKAYTLAPGTREILAKLDTPVQIRLYATQDREMPVFLKTYVQRVEDLLAEYRQASRGLVDIQVLNPEPDSDAEDSARLDGIEGELLPNGDKIYLGLSVTMLDQKQIIPFLAPNRERLLEYEITRAISRVITPKRATIGLMSPLPVAGEAPNPMMMQMGGRQQPAWVIYNELSALFTVRNVPMDTTQIPPEIEILVLIHPSNLSESTQFAIDQFLLRGGKMVAFLDPASPFTPQNPMAMMMGPPGGSTLDKLLPAWGLEFNPNLVVADLVHLANTRQGRQPAILALNETAFNGDDVVTADADNAVLVFSGAFTGQPVTGLSESVLIHSSKDSQLVDARAAQEGGEALVKGFQPSGQEYALAIRLTGKFPTAFPNGRPAPTPGPNGEPAPTPSLSQAGLRITDPTPGPNGEPAPTPPADEPAPLKEATAESSVILFGDSDLIQDPVAVQEIATPFGQRLLMPSNGNLAIAQAAVENLAGDSNLISIRSRASRERPFTVVRELQAKAESAFRSKIAQLEQSLAETEQRLAALQQSKDGSQQFILSPEQQKELANFRQQEVEVRKELKEVRRNLRTEIDALETRLKWINIAAVPILVAVVGIGLALWRRRKAAAR